MNCYIARGLEGLIPLTRAGQEPGGTGIEPEKPHTSAGLEPGGLVTIEVITGASGRHRSTV